MTTSEQGLLIYAPGYHQFMVSWPQAVARVNASSPDNLDLQSQRFSFRRGAPIVITGNSGAGKTEIWSQITRRPAGPGMSVSTDDGYIIRRNKKAHSVTTIPGQVSKDRDYAMNLMFGESTLLEGVVFVACNGYDHIWSNSDVVASALDPFDLQTLRARNKRHELASFDEVCKAITKKRMLAPAEYQPKWLLVLANKVDLYWGEVDDARRYYQIGPDSEFGLRAQELLGDLGAISLQYHTLPIAAKAKSYEFHSSRGSFNAASQLTNSQCNSSLRCLIDTLGGLWNE
ncbi:hypothetical protein J8N05_35085 [Streptomyces sp. BH-SS-21]|uniref:Uncharacterized protein n=1 Tax=Streptomyces liliiviolaceus TaxID=2823109 RepID=A0A941BCQ6_9ACTN|nr:hypothetical protein [Streptomyces liliiviolaceus]MBQ0853393.1 hypothetical protein [Streptomyces liliiviolaceus]